MRIDLRVGSTEVNQTTSASKSERPKRPEIADKSSAGTDQAHLSLDQSKMRALEDHLARLPEVRSERTRPLKAAIEGGTYQAPAEHVANAVFSEMLSRSKLIR